MVKNLIGVSLRVENVQKYNEKRDTISHDWTKFLTKINSYPILIPNGIENIQNFLERFSLNEIILSGGDNIGEFPERDKTEIDILKYAIKNRIPVLGVCRGMQIINTFFGGKVIRSKSEDHVAKPHIISFLNNNCFNKLGTKITVNSFHNNLILKDNLGQDLEKFAIANDNTVEGIFHKTFPIIGVMWHPERDNNLKFELELMKIYQNKLLWK